jgi:O-acetyl-ADP-ribose deacetylase (regulator of RNase III)
MLVFETGLLTGPRYSVNFPTKRHWKGKSRIEDIDAGLPALVEEIRKRDIRSVAVPPLGCGLGGLDWNDVRPRIVHAFEELPGVRVLVFEPAGAPRPEVMVKEKRAPGMTPGRAVLVELMSRYLAAVMDPFITLLEIHKLMYFMQEAGENLRLNYEKGNIRLLREESAARAERHRRTFYYGLWGCRGRSTAAHKTSSGRVRIGPRLHSIPP